MPRPLRHSPLRSDDSGGMDPSERLVSHDWTNCLRHRVRAADVRSAASERLTLRVCVCVCRGQPPATALHALDTAADGMKKKKKGLASKNATLSKKAATPVAGSAVAPPTLRPSPPRAASARRLNVHHQRSCPGPQPHARITFMLLARSTAPTDQVLMLPLFSLPAGRPTPQIITPLPPRG